MQRLPPRARRGFALISAALRDRLYRNRFGACARIVTANARQPGVDHISNTGIVSDVSAIFGSNHDLPTG